MTKVDWLEDDAVTSRVSVPVAVVLEKRLVEGKFWSLPSWSLSAVLVGSGLANTGAEGERVNEGKLPEQFLWSGFRVIFYKDACERYWHALIGERPLVYVVLREDEADGTVEPAIVTIDYDEAVAHTETDGQVLTADIPPELYQTMESFVLEHYKPAEFKKRKRKQWSDSDAKDREEKARRFRRRGYHG